MTILKSTKYSKHIYLIPVSTEFEIIFRLLLNTALITEFMFTISNLLR